MDRSLLCIRYVPHLTFTVLWKSNNWSDPHALLALATKTNKTCTSSKPVKNLDTALVSRPWFTWTTRLYFCRSWVHKQTYAKCMRHKYQIEPRPNLCGYGEHDASWEDNDRGGWIWLLDSVAAWKPPTCYYHLRYVNSEHDSGNSLIQFSWPLSWDITWSCSVPYFHILYFPEISALN